MNATISMTKEYYLTSLEQANTYVGEDQYTKAIKMLEPLVNSDISDIQGVISFCLGDIYRCCDGTENNIRAKEHLSRSIELASAAEDNQVVVAAKAALAQVETILGNEEQAQRYRQEARDEFQALPRPNQWKDLQQRLENKTNKVEYLLFQSTTCVCDPPGPIPYPHGRLSGNDRECRPHVCS